MLSSAHPRDRITHCTGSKSSLYDLYRANCVTIFHCARGTHWYNNYTRWFGFDGGEASIGEGRALAAAVGVPAYELPYGFLYEPWFIGHRCEEHNGPDESLWALVL